jgi:hypothetical protein
MVEKKLTLEYNSSDKFNSVIKLEQGGIYILPSSISTSKVRYMNDNYKLIGILIVSPKETNFDYEEDVKSVMVFIHTIIKKSSHELLFIHLPIVITKDSKPSVELNSFFKSIITKSTLLQKKNAIHINELSLNAIHFGNKPPIIKTMDMSKSLINYLKPNAFNKIDRYSSVTSIIVQSTINTMTVDLYNKLNLIIHSKVYPSLFIKKKKKTPLINNIMKNINTYNNSKKEGFTNKSNACSMPIYNPSYTGSSTSNDDDFYIQCFATDDEKSVGSIPYLVPSKSHTPSSLSNKETDFFSAIFSKINNKYVAMGLAGFIIVFFILFIISKLLKYFRKHHSPNNVLEHRDTINTVVETI